MGNVLETLKKEILSFNIRRDFFNYIEQSETIDSLFDSIKANFLDLIMFGMVDGNVITNHKDLFNMFDIYYNENVVNGYLLCDKGICVAKGKSYVVAQKDCQLDVFGETIVKAYNNAMIFAYDNCNIDLYNNAQCYSYNKTKVHSFDYSNVCANNKSDVKCYDNSHTIVFDNVKVALFDKATLKDLRL